MPYTSYNANVYQNNANVAEKMDQYWKSKNQYNKTSELGEAANSNSKTTTSRGTKITEYGDTGMGKDAFLKILVAQMTNLDPTQDQDSTAYVTQMAQFASIEQMNNLNDTMTGFSVRNLIGKNVTVNMADKNGNYIQGTVLGAYHSKGKYYLSIYNTADGKTYDDIDSTKVTGVTNEFKDNSDAISALNSQFSAAANLKDKRVIVVDYDEDKKPIIIKGIIKRSYLDNAEVKLEIAKLDDDLTTETGEKVIYSYLDIYKAGDLTDEDMNVNASDFEESTSNTSSNQSDDTEESDEN